VEEWKEIKCEHQEMYGWFFSCVHTYKPPTFQIISHTPNPFFDLGCGAATPARSILFFGPLYVACKPKACVPPQAGKARLGFQSSSSGVKNSDKTCFQDSLRSGAEAGWAVKRGSKTRVGEQVDRLANKRGLEARSGEQTEGLRAGCHVVAALAEQIFDLRTRAGDAMRMMIQMCAMC